MYRIAIFDIDNTLTESRSAITPPMAAILSELIDQMPVAIISGGAFKDIDSQVASHLSHAKKENLFLLPMEGAELRIFEKGEWRPAYSRTMDDSKRRRILDELHKIVKAPQEKIGDFIEDRGALIAYHAIGKEASLEEKYAWDPTQKKRLATIDGLRADLPGVFMAAAGATTINFTEEGINKAFGVRKILERLSLDPKEAVFVGDALGEGGNDAPVKSVGVDIIPTTSPEVTREIVLKIIQEIHRGSAGSKRAVAFFCMEYGIEDDIPLFAGGLGILAGDMVKEAGSRGDLRFAAFGLISRKGMKTEGSAEIDYTDRLIEAGFRKTLRSGKPLTARISLGVAEEVLVSLWEKSYGNATVYFLDTDLDQNSPGDRGLTDYLYDMDKKKRVLQEILLGVGSAKMLSLLGIRPDVYHFNEGHTGFAALSCILEYGTGDTFAKKAKSLRDAMVGTKHTILSGAGTYLSHEEFNGFLGTYIRSKGAEVEDVYEIGALERNKDTFSTTRFLMKVSGRTNGVSRAHVLAEKDQYPESELKTVTNGVDVSRWQASRLQKDGDGRKSLFGLAEAKRALRRELVSYVNETAGSKLKDDVLTLVWARRFAAYKRPGLLWNDLNELLSLVNDESMPLQIIVAGKAHPLDMEGVRAKSLVESAAADPRFKGRIAYLPHYSIDTAKLLVKGADVWLNTPIPGFEACGTSGMKAGLNGSIVMSTNDGWVAEEPLLRDIGFIIPEDAIEKNLYRILRDKAIPGFYAGDTPGMSDEWLMRMRETISLVETKFNAARMLDDYLEKMYNFHS